MRFRSLVAMLPLLVPVAAAAADDLELFSTDRPDLTEGAARVGRRVWQVEGGWSFTSGGGSTAHSLGDALLRFGLEDHVELRLFVPSLEWNSARGASHAGFGDVGFGAKLGVSSADDSRAGAVLFAVSAPTRADVHPAETREAIAAGDLDLPAGFGVGANLGVRWEVSRDASFGFATLSVGRDLSQRASVFLEVVGERRADQDTDWANLMDGGGSVAVAHGLQLDGSIGRALEEGGDWFGGLGVSRRW